MSLLSISSSNITMVVGYRLREMLSIGVQSSKGWLDLSRSNLQLLGEANFLVKLIGCLDRGRSYLQFGEANFLAKLITTFDQLHLYPEVPVDQSTISHITSLVEVRFIRILYLLSLCLRDFYEVKSRFGLYSRMGNTT